MEVVQKHKQICFNLVLLNLNNSLQRKQVNKFANAG